MPNEAFSLDLQSIYKNLWIFLCSCIFRISYCSADATYDHIFNFIATNSNNTMECHAFLCKKRKIVSPNSNLLDPPPIPDWKSKLDICFCWNSIKSKLDIWPNLDCHKITDLKFQQCINLTSSKSKQRITPIFLNAGPICNPHNCSGI